MEGVPYAFPAPHLSTNTNTHTGTQASFLTSRMDVMSSEGSSLEARRDASCSSGATGRYVCEAILPVVVCGVGSAGTG